jgi:hypothetical protein
MPCAECEAFMSAYTMASEHYAATVAALHKLATNGHFKDARYQNLKAQVEQARDACEMAKAALRVHREGHEKT